MKNSKGDERYFISFIDDYLRCVWVYYFRFKDNDFDTFKEWKDIIENQMGRRIKKILTDNGLEFYSNEFEKFCRREEIVLHTMVVNTPQ